MFKKSGSSVKLFSHDDDTPRDGRGMLIPRRRRGSDELRFSPASTQGTSARSRSFGTVGAVALGVFALALISVTGYGAFDRMAQVAAPVITIVDPYTQTSTALEYGPQPALAKNNFFVETRDVFIDEALTFVEVDMTKRQLRYFVDGVLVQSAEVQAVGEEGSWWDTPSGLYQVEEKQDRVFTNLGQAYLPWQIKFQRNFAIHGWPTYPDGERVSPEFTGGGIRLPDESAQRLFNAVSVNTPVLVHAEKDMRPDTFVYEPQVPEFDAQHYFIADIQNGTILAASDLDTTAPIASVTKLMTAVVAAEQLDLDGRVRVTSPTFVTSLIPRLSERSSVSMYSLMQLLLVESSNEAAETIAGELGREDFMSAMNAKARQLGMMNTNFADPSGLSADNTSSLGDLYTLARYIENERPFIFDITANAEISTANSGGEFDSLVNFNDIEDMDSFLGGKVGETNAAGQTSVSLHAIDFNDQPRVLVVILLGSNDRTADIKSLIEYVDYRYGRE